MRASGRSIAPVALVLSGLLGTAALALDLPGFGFAIRPSTATAEQAAAASVPDPVVEGRSRGLARASRSGRLPSADADGAASNVDTTAEAVAAVAAASDLDAERAAPAPGTSVQWPATGDISGVYGERRRRHIHPGMDIDGETGDPVVAAAPGTVIHAGPAPDGYGGYGNLVVIDHGAGVQTMSAHLSKITVVVGQAVQPGDLVGAIGTSGHVTGSHLHFEVRVNGATIDPAAWLPPRGGPN